MPTCRLIIAGEPDVLAASLVGRLHPAMPRIAHMLVNAGTTDDIDQVQARSMAFAACVPVADEALIVTILVAPPPGLDDARARAASVGLWDFTRQAALAWAPRRIRVNALGLGASPTLPFGPMEDAGRAAGAVAGQAATLEDIVRTLLAMAAWPSMTGQIIRLGA